MRSPHWLMTLAVPALIGAALVTGPATASADPRDDGYLSELKGMGFSWPAGHEMALVEMAGLICQDLGWGWTPDQIAYDMHVAMKDQGVQYGQAAGMVNVARGVYCPTQRCWAAHC